MKVRRKQVVKRNTRELDSYLNDVRDRQNNLTWPGVLKGSRSVDEYLWKGAKDAPMVQRIGAVLLALMYISIAAAAVDLAAQQHSWFLVAFGIIFFSLAGVFIRNALLK